MVNETLSLASCAQLEFGALRHKYRAMSEVQPEVLSDMQTPPEKREPEVVDPALAALAAQIRACRACVEAPDGAPLPHEPRPVIRESSRAKILIASQAPGIRAPLRPAV
jgi:hypothetical protein